MSRNVCVASLALREKLGQVYRHQSGSILRERQCVNDHLHVWQDRQIMLFAVAERFAVNDTLGNQQRRPFCLRSAGEGYGVGGTSAKLNLLRIGNYFLAGLWVYEQQPCHATLTFLARIEYTCCDGRLITLSNKARHVGLYHNVFLCDSLTVEHSVVHISIVSQS